MSPVSIYGLRIFVHSWLKKRLYKTIQMFVSLMSAGTRYLKAEKNRYFQIFLMQFEIRPYIQVQSLLHRHVSSLYYLQVTKVVWIRRQMVLFLERGVLYGSAFLSRYSFYCDEFTTSNTWFRGISVNGCKIVPPCFPMHSKRIICTSWKISIAPQSMTAYLCLLLFFSRVMLIPK